MAHKSLKVFKSSGLHTKIGRSLQGIIFDMDGTLTVPVLDFKLIRQRINCPLNSDILGFVNGLDEPAKSEAHKTIKEWEEEGNRNMKLQPYLHDLFHLLKHNLGLRTALLTRNTIEGANYFVKKFLESSPDFKSESELFCKIVTRDFVPVKPDPAAVHHICAGWGCSPENVMVVGDDKTDIQCGNSAGAVTVLMKSSESSLKAEGLADYSIHSLHELIELLQTSQSTTKESVRT